MPQYASFASLVSASDPDWSREQCQCWWHPAPQLLRSIRQYQKWRDRGFLGRIVARFWILQHRFWSVVAATDIPITCNIAGGLLMPHPTGVVIHPSAQIGPNCAIFQQVTIVSDVVVGGHVDIGAGAKIIRGVTIGDHVQIGANAVVLEDVPAGAVVVGIPARIVRYVEPYASQRR
ncbi:MAG: serine acetyltransferase [Leptolyngbyaceae cyanobacterium SM1_3_5]|nr:serine acetyltransferase [Leptolyngbyaceae cyanobacterium SM1_3_5]